MIVRLLSGGLHGIEAHDVEIEVDFARQGLPAFNLVGLPETEVREARDRVLAALRASGCSLPPGRVTVNMAPAGARKSGTGYDLPLALGLLAAAGQLEAEKLQGWYFAAELSLSGALRAVPGMLSLAMLARQSGARGLVVAPGNAVEAAVVQGLDVYAPQSLAQCLGFLAGQIELEPEKCQADCNARLETLDFAEVKGQAGAKRAMEVAAAGGHNLLMVGPPGSGKTMLAQRLPGILPPLSFSEALEVTRVYSVAGLLPGGGLMRQRPFRSPHHTISDVALAGGGRRPGPGEISLAHRGVLFLDELTEYSTTALETLRQPMEDGEVHISRASGSVSFPADFMLVAAMNPCHCGWLGDSRHKCTCTAAQLARYRRRISGPLLDRIDLHVEVPGVAYHDLATDSHEAFGGCWSSEAMAKRVLQARQIQSARYAGQPEILCNAGLRGRWIDRYCRPRAEAMGLLRSAMDSLGLLPRAYMRILKLSRTIADLADSPEPDGIGPEHMAEAISLRALDRAAE